MDGSLIWCCGFVTKNNPFPRSWCRSLSGHSYFGGFRAGPMLVERFKGKKNKGPSDVLAGLQKILKMGKLSPRRFIAAEAACPASVQGQLCTMGTASTMAACWQPLAWLYRITQPSQRQIQGRKVLPTCPGECGSWNGQWGLKMSKIFNPKKALWKCIMVNAALGGSTKFHSKHLNCYCKADWRWTLEIDRFRSFLFENPTDPQNVQPSGRSIGFEDLFYAGGLACRDEKKSRQQLIRRKSRTMVKPLERILRSAAMLWSGIWLRDFCNPIKPESGIAVPQ